MLLKKFSGIWWLFGLFLSAQLVESLRITSLDVPKTAYGTTTLNCRYDLEDETLYAVKWYKDNVEFFRCLADGTVHEFRIRDIEIYTSGRSHIGACYFQLTILSEKSGGDYMCEVSLDGPTFLVAQATEHLQVVDPPTIKQIDTEISNSMNEPEINMYASGAGIQNLLKIKLFDKQKFSTGSNRWKFPVDVLMFSSLIAFNTIL